MQTSVRIHRGDSIIAGGIKKGWALLPAKRPAGPVIHKLVDPLGNSLPGLYAIQIPSRRQFTDALSDMRRSFSAVLLDDLLRGNSNQRSRFGVYANQRCSHYVPRMPTLNKNDTAIIKLSLQILASARDDGSQQAIRTDAVRLALRCLRPYMREKWPLITFWDAGESENELGRSASTTASLNGIVHQLRSAGIKVDDIP